MLEKFLISIGLKQPESVEQVISTQKTTVRPSGENRFIDDENIGDIRVHSPKDEVEIKALRSFSEIHNFGIAIKDEFIVAKIINAEQHPNADRLRVCNVDIGKKEIVKVVCGASNAKKDLITVYAPPGAVIPKIKWNYQ